MADTQNNRVRRITPDGIIRTFAGTGEPAFSGDGGQAGKAALNQPRGLAFGPDGILYIADTLNNRVRVVTANGIIRTAAGEGHARFGGDGGPAAAASLNLPTSVTVDKSGNLFVVDSVNFRIRKVTPAGVITTVAGSQGSDDYNFRAVVRLPLQLQGQPFRFTARHGRAPERMVKSTFPMQLRSGVLTVMGT